ncbi:family 78 glycoside hydrolase catalytic domain [Streptomyces hawaiiensis]|uniref:family 78 glycoside hydrolase catalytic domain n=1 Tax=Streptomyces hawaiiensis TaxID=67305 RepID=UPI001FE697A7|nr:family 78 glycoside hydrolase catalytic domain [Streptomyces hawaiiensis]
MLNKNGTLYTDNFRSAKVTDRYVFAESGKVTYEPTFTQHGFRYIEITGVTEPPSLFDVKGVVWGSDLPTTGTLKTSDGMLNQVTLRRRADSAPAKPGSACTGRGTGSPAHQGNKRTQTLTSSSASSPPSRDVTQRVRYGGSRRCRGSRRPSGSWRRSWSRRAPRRS